MRKRNLIPFGLVLLALILYGYQFNNGDQEEFLPYVYRILNPTLYPGDPLVEFQMRHFNIRFFTAYFLAGGGYLFGVQAWTFIVHFISLFFISRSLTVIAIRRSPWNPALYLPSLFLLILYSFPVGGNTLFDNQLTPTMPALALGCIALERFDVKKFELSLFLCGIASCFQLLIGLHLMILFLFCIFWDRHTMSFKSKLKLPFYYLVSALPILFPLMYRQFFMPVVYDKGLYFEILFIFRNAHHYSPSHFPVIAYIKAALFVSIMIFIFLRQTREKNGKAPQFMVVVILGCIFYTIGFEIYRVEAIAKSQWFKSTIWMVLYAIPVLSAFCSDYLRRNVQIANWKLLVACAIAILFLFNSGNIPFEKTAYRYRLGQYKKGDLQLLHEWINRNLPPDAVVLSFPSDDALRSETQRSSPVTFKAIVHEPEFMVEWYRLINTYYQLAISSGNSMNEKLITGDRLFHLKTVPAWIRLDKDVDCLIVNEMHLLPGKLPPGKKLAQFGPYLALGRSR